MIEDLTTGPMPAGSIVIVEYDPASQWYNALSTIVAVWIATGGRVFHNVAAAPSDNARAQLRRLGLDVEELERNGRLTILDWYTATLGQKSKEKYAFDSLKVADLSIRFSKAGKGDADAGIPSPVSPDVLRVQDDCSFLARFNDEKSMVEFLLTRFIPGAWKGSGIFIGGAIRGIHSDWVYKQLEAACDGIIDFKLEETGEEPKNLIRIRSMRNVGFDARWHQLRVRENFEVVLEK